MKKLLTACMLLTAVSAQSVERKSMDVTVKVADEQGRPVPGAFIIGGSERGSNEVSKRTDGKGQALFKDAARMGSFDPKIVHPGFYMSWGCFIINVREPGNEREYVVPLRKVINPVPIETKKMDYLIGRKFDEDIGFDLEKLDWVPPHGAGVHTDLVVRARWERITDARDDWDRPKPGLRSIVTIRTSGPGNGFLPFKAERVLSSTEPGSIFMPPHQVPTAGLTNQICVTVEEYDGFGDRYSETESKHYAFRVRSQFDETGGLSRAHVGWIEGRVIACAFYFPEGRPNGPRPKPSEAIPDRFGLKFTRHWNPNPESNSLEPNTPEMRWENQLSSLIRGYKLQDLPGIEELKPLDRKDPQWIPSPEEKLAERRAEEAERIRQRQAVNKASLDKYYREHPDEAERYYKDHPEERPADVPNP